MGNVRFMIFLFINLLVWVFFNIVLDLKEIILVSTMPSKTRV